MSQDVGPSNGTGPSARLPGVRPLRRSDQPTIGPYQLVGRVGSGGMGMAYLATDPQGRSVVVKTLREEWVDNPSFMTRFAREAHCLSRVRDQRIVRVVDRDLSHDPPFLVTEYVPGPTLRQQVDSAGPLGLEQVRQLARELSHAIVAMHEAGLAHRDLTPANVILSPAGPRVIDFGLAKDAHAADGSTLIGTPGWVPPEALMGQHAGAPADVFLWGELVAYAATGRAPFGEDGFEASAHRTLHQQPDVSGLPEDLAGMVYAALSTDPAARPAAWHLAAWLAPPPAPGRPGAGSGPATVATNVIAAGHVPGSGSASPQPGEGPQTARPDDTHALPPEPPPPRTPSVWRRSPALRVVAYGSALGLLSALVFGLTDRFVLTFESNHGPGIAFRILAGLQEVLPFGLAMALLAAILLGPRNTWWRAVSQVLPVLVVVSIGLSLLWGWFGSLLVDPYSPRASGLMIPAAFAGSMAIALVIRSMPIGLATLAAALLAGPLAGWLVAGVGLPYESYLVTYGAAIGTALAIVGWTRRQRLARQDQSYAQFGPSPSAPGRQAA